MKYKKLNDCYVVRIEQKEEVVTALQQFIEEKNLRNGVITGIGAADDIEVGFYNVKDQNYVSKTFKGELEVSSFVGNVSEMNGEPYLHMHITFADEDLRLYGGHLNRCVISGTGELFIQLYEGKIDRFKEDATGLNIFDLKND